MRRLLLLTATALMGLSTTAAVAIPASAAAHRAPAHHYNCRLRSVAYRASGTLDRWALVQDGNGTWSGSLTVSVLRGGRAARGETRTATTYTVTGAVVRFGRGTTNPPAVNSRIHLVGRALAVPPRCATTSSPTTVSYAVRVIRVDAPAKPKHHPVMTHRHGHHGSGHGKGPGHNKGHHHS